MGAGRSQQEITGTTYLETKTAIYQKIQVLVKLRTGIRISVDTAREIFDLGIEEMILSTVDAESFRFNRGLGFLRVIHMPPQLKTLPGGTEIQIGARRKLAFQRGPLAKAILDSPSKAFAKLGKRRLWRQIQEEIHPTN